jgi:flavin reductase (DIM6/NTAB) family NADH-FMN oxidoreductase RutF
MTTFTTNQDLDPGSLRKAFGIFPSGVVAVAARVDEQLVGLAASSFTSMSIDPPLVSVNLSATSKTWPDLRRADHLGITVLAAHQDRVCHQLAGPVERRFDGVPHVVTHNGAVMLADGLAQFDCTVYREVEAGDHILVLLELHGVEHVDDARSEAPLVFHRSAFGGLAPAR